MPLQLKRIYQEAEESDGTRVLVDRLWPRGVSKAQAKLDWWAKELAPSTELRHWFNHQPEKYPEFVARYARELEGNPALERMKGLASSGLVTLLYAAKDEEHNDATALKALLEDA
jgi:uncharacterized protein YeaO (DUF488 family)